MSAKNKPKIRDQVVVSKPPRSYKKLLLLIGAIIVVIVAAGAIYYVHRSNNSNKVADEECSSGPNTALLQQAATSFDSAKIAQLQQVVAKIQKIPNYQKDPNCLYPIVTYYINADNPQKASFYLDKLQTIYNPKVGFSHYLGNIVGIQTLQDNITFLQQNAKQAQNNAMTFSARP